MPEEPEESMFEVIISEVKRWAGIIEKTATEILDTQPKKEN